MKRLVKTDWVARSAAVKASPARKGRVTGSELAMIEKLYREGSTVMQVSQRVGVHRTTVLRHLDRLGVETGHRKLREEDVAACVLRYDSGETCRQIAIDYDVHPDTVRRRLVKSGVKMRSGQFGQRTTDT